MKISTLLRISALALPLATTSLGLSHLASAQPTTPRRAKRGRRAKGGISAKLLAAIEAKTGKAVTPDQKTQLDAAADTHRVAVKSADENFRASIARITGISPADAQTLGRKPRAPKTVAPKA